MFNTLDKISELRKKYNVSEYHLSIISGIPESTIDIWYQKKISPPISDIEKICHCLGITLYEFFDSDENVYIADENLIRILKKRYSKNDKRNGSSRKFLRSHKKRRGIAMNTKIMRIFIVLFTFVLAGFLQANILHPEIYDIYLGLSISIWSLCWFILYNAIVHIASYISII